MTQFTVNSNTTLSARILQCQVAKDSTASPDAYGDLACETNSTLIDELVN